MREGERKHESSTLVVSASVAVPEHMRERLRELISVHTPTKDRRKGYATALLRQVCEEADGDGSVLMLTANVGLVHWYRRFGFVELPMVDGADKVLMARQPRGVMH